MPNDEEIMVHVKDTPVRERFTFSREFVYFLVALSTIIVISILLCILLQFNKDYLLDDRDGWLRFSIELTNALIDPGYSMNPPFSFQTYNHSFTPLYPFMSAVLGIFMDNKLAMMIVSAILSTMTIPLLGLFLKNHYKMEGKSLYLFLLFFATSYLHVFNFSITTTETLIIFCMVLNVYTLDRYWRKDSIVNGLLVGLSYGLTLFAREILYPMLGLPLLFFAWKALVRYLDDGDAFFTGKNFKSFIKVSIYSMGIPVAVFSLFILGFDLVPAIISTGENLAAWDKSIKDLVQSLVKPFFFMILVAAAVVAWLIWESLKDSKKLDQFLNTNDEMWILPWIRKHAMFLLWFVVFVASRFLLPGPFWKRYWVPVEVIICFLTWVFVEKYLTRDLLKYGFIILNFAVTVFFILHDMRFVNIPFI